jgi:hypothetical protein
MPTNPVAWTTSAGTHARIGRRVQMPVAEAYRVVVDYVSTDSDEVGVVGSAAAVELVRSPLVTLGSWAHPGGC